MVRRSVESSLTLGCYEPDGDAQVGVCRWVTDGATFGWLCDVFVEALTGERASASFWSVPPSSIPEVRDLRLLLLATRTRTGLYERFGFMSPTASFMERRPGKPRR